MAMRALRLRRVLISIGASDDQADEFVNAIDELPSKQDLGRALAEMEQRLVNRMLLIGIGLSGLVIAAMALLTQL